MLSICKYFGLPRHRAIELGVVLLAERARKKEITDIEVSRLSEGQADGSAVELWNRARNDIGRASISRVPRAALDLRISGSS